MNIGDCLTRNEIGKYERAIPATFGVTDTRGEWSLVEGSVSLATFRELSDGKYLVLSSFWANKDKEYSAWVEKVRVNG